MKPVPTLSITPVREHHGESRAELEAELQQEGDPEIGYYHSYEITGAVDGPGVRFTLFLSGCPLRCQYCENPDMWTVRNGRRVTTRRTVCDPIVRRPRPRCETIRERVVRPSGRVVWQTRQVCRTGRW